MIVVLANGCFDVFHSGHLAHLKEAKRMGDRLIVALTVDDCVLKGPRRPINSWERRAELLQELRCVDAVISTRSACGAIYKICPHIFVKGVDYAEGNKFTEPVVEVCKDVGTLLRFTSSPKQSASEIIRRVAP